MDKLPLSEYPRPQLKRDSYVSLNGYWKYKISEDESLPRDFDGEILVPFSPETPLSGVEKNVTPEDYLFYEKEIEIDKKFLKDKLIIHFGAVDQIADVYFNSELMIHHIGGFLPFKIIIDKKKVKDKNIILLRVKDYSDTLFYSFGKQRIKRGGIWYSPQSGIYMPVWMESVSDGYIRDIKITPDIDNSLVNILVDSDYPLIKVIFQKKEYVLDDTKQISLKIDNPHLWSPEDPYLYEFEVVTKDDKVSSYFAMRKFSVIDVDGIKRLALNNKPYFMKGVLDQGYYKDGYLTPTSIGDYENDIKLLKELGFNTVRKHIKIESMIWYHLCDKLGLIVWQDFVNGGSKYKFSTIAFPLITGIHHKDNNYKKFARLDEEGRKQTYQEFVDTMDLLYNVPSLGLWTIFNEGWGQFDAKEIYEKLKEKDKTRLFDHASGWHDQGVSDVKSLHVYFKRVKIPSIKKIDNRSVILSECGGYHLPIEGHKFSDVNFGYKKLKDALEFEQEYAKFIQRDVMDNIPKGLSAFIYTQLSDVEDELNGFITYDRKVVKIDPLKIKAINDKVHY